MAASSSAFVPTSNKASFVRPAVISSNSKIVKVQTEVSPSSPALQMGVMEDFITGTDEKARQKENDEYLAKLQKRVDTINGLEPDIEDLGDEELQAKTTEFKERLAKGEDINGPILEEAFAVVREAAW